MEITDLNAKEQLALIGLARLIVKADAELSDDEDARVKAIRDAMGAERFYKMALLARKSVKSREDVITVMDEIDRPEARASIIEQLQELAGSDGLVDAEEELLEWVKSRWG